MRLALCALATAALAVAPAAQVTTFDVTFDQDAVGGAPRAVPGLGGLRPTGLFG